MSEFRVHEAALEDFAVRLDELHAQCAPAREYVRSHLDLGLADAGLLMSTVLMTTSAARDDVIGLLDKLATITAASAAEIRESAQAYRDTDSATQRRMSSHRR